MVLLRERTRPGLGIMEPFPGPAWIHKIKHDGFRILSGKDSAGVPANCTRRKRFLVPVPLITTSKLPVRSCLMDSEAIVCDENASPF
jgi:ATP-dependent DNA ligase